MEIIYRIVAFLLRRELVWLRDFDDEVVLRISRRTPFGLSCCRMWPGDRKPCLLLPDGSVRGPGYVDGWKPYNA